ncbi:MAG: DUF1697 domain-containing protein [Thermoleophilia bacterium]|nr:DUF1697 domain-containing protein [Thermoleophilia bacterium]
MATGAWVALLRAVNLGARNKVSMARLREVLAAEGCERVRTYIASGNAVFRSDAARDELARRLERAIEQEFGVATPVILRTAEELASVVERHPYDDASRTHVAFLAAKPAAVRVRALAELDVAPDRIVVDGLEAYWHLPGGVQGSRLSGARLEKELGVAATVRNWRTVTRLAEMASEP